MTGAIIGDIAGSIYEFHNTRDYNFPLFSEGVSYTDDTICTVAVADAILNGKTYKDSVLEWCGKYPHPMGCYGGGFSKWLRSPDHEPYNSFGNGSAMRVSPVAYAFPTMEKVLEEAGKTAAITHNHKEGIKGANAVAGVIFALRESPSVDTVLDVGNTYYPDFQKREYCHGFNETCQGTVPLCLKLVLDCTSFEDAVRKAVSWGGDSDTIGAIVGSLAEPLFGIPEGLEKKALSLLPEDMLSVVKAFKEKYPVR